MWLAFANAKATHILSANVLASMTYLMIKVLKITNDVVSFEQLGSGKHLSTSKCKTNLMAYKANVDSDQSADPCSFICVEVWRLSQPIRVMSSVVSLPSHIFSWAGLVLWEICAYSFARNWELPYLNQVKGENDHRKYFMINLHNWILPDLAGIKSVTWSPDERTSEWATLQSDQSLQ